MTKKSKHPGRKVGHEVTQETRDKIAQALAGRKNGPPSPETRAKISQAKKGKPHPELVGRPVSDETRKKMRAAHLGNKHCLGHHHTEETRRKLSEIAKARGTKHNFYVDGDGDTRRKERQASRLQLETRLWREAVFVRDDYTCQICGVRGSVKLNADHSQPWKNHPELRFDVNNGRTLCVTCHRKTPTFGSKLNHLG